MHRRWPILLFYYIKFKIVTDCKAFEMTLRKKDLTTRVARWVLLLEDYDYEHRAGDKMKHTDALSRIPYVALNEISLHDSIKKAQEQDDGNNAINEILQSGTYKDYCISNGLLVKGLEDKLVIPKGLEKQIISKIHSNGHFSKKKMIELIEKDYYIKNLAQKIEDFIVTCVPYLLASRKEGKAEGFLDPIEKEETALHTLH